LNLSSEYIKVVHSVHFYIKVHFITPSKFTILINTDMKGTSLSYFGTSLSFQEVKNVSF